MDRQTIAGLGATVIILLIVLELVRRRRLREEYSLLWLLTGVVLIVLSVWSAPLDLIAQLTGIYRPTVLLVVAFAFLLLIMLHFSTVLTRLAEHNKTLAQEIALLAEENRALRAQVDAASVDDDTPPDADPPFKIQNYWF